MPELPPIREDATLDASQFVGELQAMAREANDAANAFARLLAEIKAVDGAMNDMARGASEAAAAAEKVAGASAGVAAAVGAETSAVRDLAVAWTEEAAAQAAAAAAADAFGRDVARSSAEFEAFMSDRLHASMQNLEHDLYVIGHSAGELDPVNAALGMFRDDLYKLGLSAEAAVPAVDDAGGAAGRAGVSFRLWGIGMGLTRNALHWVVAGAAEFLAVAVPATYALAAGLAVAAQGAQNVQQHFSALYAATESTYAAMHQTVGSVLGLRSALQNAQNAANPGVYEVLGSAVNDAKVSFHDFASTGLDVVHMFDEFAARVTVDLKSGLGDQLHNLLGTAVTDLQRFGNVLGNLGHALLNFAAAMPGLADVLLHIAVNLSQVIEWASRGGVFLTLAMGMEEFYRWGGLALSMLVRLLGLTSAMNALGTGGFIFRFGAALLALGQGAGIAIQWIGSMIGRLGALIPALTGAGAAVETFGFDLKVAAATTAPLMVAGIAGIVAATAIAVIALGHVKDATDQWIASSDQAVQKASDLNVLPTIYKNLGDNTIRLAASQRTLAGSMQHVTETSGVLSRYVGGVSGVVQRQAQDTAELSQHMLGLVTTANTVRGNLSLLAGAFHTSEVGALALANAAGVNLQVGLTKGSVAAKIAEQQITNLKTGLGAMAAPAGMIGAEMEAVGVQSQLASSKVGQVNQSLDAFIAGTTGGMNSIMQFNAALHAMGNDTVSGSQRINGAITSISASAAKMGYTLQGIGPHAQQSWQQFDAALQQANSVMDTFRTGMAEGIVSQKQYQTELNAVGGSLLPYAAHSQTALKMVSQLSQEMGGPAIHSLKGLEQAFGVTGKQAQEMATGGMERLIGRMSNLNVVARNLSATVSTQLDSATASAIVSASGLDQKYKTWATDVMSGKPAATLAGDLAKIRSAQDQVNSVEGKATKLLDNNKVAATQYGGALKGVTTGATGAGDAVKKATAMLAQHATIAHSAADAAQGFGTQAHAAAGQASGLSSNAQQATAQVKNLGTAASTTRGSLGTVNNEIRNTATAASGSAGPLNAMAGNIRNVGSSAATAAGEVHGLASAIASLQSKTITVTTNVVTVTSTIHRAMGGPTFPGVPTVVGEQGPELYIPATSGYILPAPQTQQILAGAGGGGQGGQAQAINLTAELHSHHYLDGKQILTSVQTHGAQWIRRNRGQNDGIWVPT